MTAGYNVTIRNARLNLVRDAIDAGPGPGTLDFYTAPRPTTGATPTGATLLGTTTFSDPCAPDAAGGVLSFNPIAQDPDAADGGPCAWARGQDSAGNFVVDLTVSGPGGGGEIELNNPVIVVGGPIIITSAKIIGGNP
jgi:hypothetical protein